MKRKWTEEEINYLYQSWGESSVENIAKKYIAKKLNRTTTSILSKAYKLGLPSPLKMGEKITLSELAKILNISYTTIISWKKNKIYKYKRKMQDNSPTIS